MKFYELREHLENYGCVQHFSWLETYLRVVNTPFGPELMRFAFNDDEYKPEAYSLDWQEMFFDDWYTVNIEDYR